MTSRHRADLRPRRLAEQIVLVTGGARGLGRALTEAFLHEGARVVINHLTSEGAALELAERHPGRAVAVRADVRDRAQVEALFTQAEDAFGAPVDTVVNNALTGFSFNGDARAKAHEIPTTPSPRSSPARCRAR